MELDKKIEALLFYKAEPMTVLKLSTMLGEGKGKIGNALDVLEEKLENRGLVLIREGDNVALGTHPNASSFIEALMKEELSKDLGKAGLETLTIILYRGPLTRSEIDYIRGVNSSYILRNLSTRGLIQKATNPDDGRALIYRPTLELLSYLGVKKVNDLPEYDKVKSEIEEFQSTNHSNSANGNEYVD